MKYSILSTSSKWRPLLSGSGMNITVSSLLCRFQLTILDFPPFIFIMSTGSAVLSLVQTRKNLKALAEMCKMTELVNVVRDGVLSKSLPFTLTHPQ